MAVGKNKKLGKKRKGGRKVIDPFESKKEWYSVKAPNMFAERDLGYTVCSKSAGLKLARDTLVGRVLEVSQADLQTDKEASDDAFRKFKLKVDEVQGMNCLTNFYGMDLTTDKIRSLVKKNQTLIEAYVDVKTTDGYVLRLFCIGFTKKAKGHQKKTSYAKASQVRKIRAKMVEIMQREASVVDLAELVQRKLLTASFGRVIVKATRGIYPLTNVMMRKVKMIKSPKVDISKLLELHGGAVSTAVLDTGAAVDRPEE